MSQVRWTDSSAGFQMQIKHLVGDVLLSTGFLSYAGPFNQEYRGLLLSLWKKEMEEKLIPFTSVQSSHLYTFYLGQFWSVCQPNVPKPDRSRSSLWTTHSHAIMLLKEIYFYSPCISGLECDWSAGGQRHCEWMEPPGFTQRWSLHSEWHCGYQGYTVPAAYRPTGSGQDLDPEQRERTPTAGEGRREGKSRKAGGAENPFNLQ